MATATASTSVVVPLFATLEVPPVIGRGAVFAVTMRVTNGGSSPATLAPSTLTPTGSANSVLVSSPAGLTIPAQATASFVWTYRATQLGTVGYQGSASGTDGASNPIATPVVTSNLGQVLESYVTDADVFGDGSRFGFVAGYRGKVYIGPNQTGSTAVRMAPDGASGEAVSFTFAADLVGNKTNNGSAPLTSIGSTGCIANTPACGPDNENGRGLFASGMLGGTEWLVLAGARSSGDLEYVYMTSDGDGVLDFSFVDLSAFLGGATRGLSAMHAFGNRLYLGFGDTGGSRPYFVAVSTVPTAPGLDATAADAVDLDADDFPGGQQHAN
jgi:hypothetical protein